jgi:hypothetical protein
MEFFLCASVTGISVTFDKVNIQGFSGSSMRAGERIILKWITSDTVCEDSIGLACK